METYTNDKAVIISLTAMFQWLGKVEKFIDDNKTLECDAVYRQLVDSDFIGAHVMALYGVESLSRKDFEDLVLNIILPLAGDDDLDIGEKVNMVNKFMLNKTR